MDFKVFKVDGFEQLINFGVVRYIDKHPNGFAALYYTETDYIVLDDTYEDVKKVLGLSTPSPRRGIKRVN